YIVQTIVRRRIGRAGRKNGAQRSDAPYLTDQRNARALVGRAVPCTPSRKSRRTALTVATQYHLRRALPNIPAIGRAGSPLPAEDGPRKSARTGVRALPVMRPN